MVFRNVVRPICSESSCDFQVAVFPGCCGLESADTFPSRALALIDGLEFDEQVILDMFDADEGAVG